MKKNGKLLKGPSGTLGMRNVIFKIGKSWITSKMKTAEGEMTEMKDRVKEISRETTGSDKKGKKNSLVL